jgi:hypothetical protein
VAGRERNAQIAADAIEGERAAALFGVLDDHGGADRVIDGREHAEREQCDPENRQRRRESRRDQREATADIKCHHQIAPIPTIAEPSGRQREQAEGDKRSGRECDQRCIGAPVYDRQFDNHGRIDQHHEMIECMRPIEETDDEPTRRLGGPGVRQIDFGCDAHRILPRSNALNI